MRDEWRARQQELEREIARLERAMWNRNGGDDRWSGANLTPEQIADRDAVMADPIYPVPEGPARDQMPNFMGWNRYEWSAAPEPLIDYFEMREAFDGWRGEFEALERDMDRLRQAHNAEVDRITAEHGEDTVRKVMGLPGERGTFHLLEEYRKDPTLSTYKGRGGRRRGGRNA